MLPMLEAVVLGNRAREGENGGVRESQKEGWGRQTEPDLEETPGEG